MRKPVGPNTPSKPELLPHLASIEVDAGLVKRFRPEAAARETTVPHLINDLLNIIITDGLTRAIIDD